jgi:hypothetical protein
METCSWPLGNGESLKFTVFDFETEWNDVSGLYIFAHLKDGYWRPVYIGQALSFAQRLSDHEQEGSARQLGATHVHALVVPLAANRDKWERMLIQHLHPDLNTHYRNPLG